MHKNNQKEFELSGVIPYLNAGYTGKGWKFTTLETLGLKDKHAEKTIAVYNEYRPDAEFIKFPISTTWSSSNIENAIDWCIENDIRTILVSIDTYVNSTLYNSAFSKAKKHGIMIANAIGNKNKEVFEDKRLGTLSELESVGAVYWHDKLRELKRASYSNRSETLDYVDFTNIYLPEYDLHFNGTSCASPSFNAKRDILREYLEVNYGISDYETVMRIIDENLLDLGEVGRDDYYGKGLFVLPDFAELEKICNNLDVSDSAKTNEEELTKSDNNLDISDFAKIPREELMKLGITDGTRPKDLVTREEEWTMLYRLLSYLTNK